MPVKDVVAEVEGHKIAVQNAWQFDRTLTGSVETKMTLSVDDLIVASTSQSSSISTRKPVLRVIVQIGHRSRIVEVFCRAIVTTRIKICVDGEKVAGDL